MAGKEKAKRGPKSKFKEEFVEQAYKLCLLGLTDKQMADVFGVTEQTFNNWKKEYPELFESITRGKEIADADVAASLRERAIGYSHDDVHISSYEGRITVTPIKKHYPPDTQAAAIWLYNRQPSKWRRSPPEGSDGEEAKPVKFEINVVDARKNADTE